MKNVLVIASMLAMVACAGKNQASETASASKKESGLKFSCGSVGGTEEWRISIDLQKNQASFFDNDTTVVLPLKEFMILESNPPQLFYTFEGKDSGSDETLHISFNKSRLTGGVTLDAKGPGNKYLEAEEGCVADDSIEIE